MKYFIVLIALCIYHPLIAQVVVVNSANAEAITNDDVKSIFKVRKTKWASGGLIKILLPKLESAEGIALLANIYALQRSKFKKFWMLKVFRGEAQEVPESMSVEAIKAELEKNPNAIGVLPDNMVTEKMKKILSIK